MPFQVNVGSWNSIDKLSLSRAVKESSMSGVSDPMTNKTFVITSILVCKVISKGYWLIIFHIESALHNVS